MKKLALLACLAFSCAAWADPQPSASPAPTTVSFGGFIDTYYSYDFEKPPQFDRKYTTQPARANEFNVNLAFVEAKVSGDRVHGRLALQAGTSVQAAYASEPMVGTISGPLLSRFLQEAYVGYRFTDTLWIDAGIYLSHIGFEDFISRDNWTYSRSLAADFSPYYQSGARAVWQVTPSFSAQFHVINGWQNISENTASKALGLQLSWSANDSLTLTNNDYYGLQVGSLYRFFNDFIARYSFSDAFQVAGTFDLGTQARPIGANSTWYDGTLIARYAFSPRWALAGRLERFSDPDQVVAITVSPNGFVVDGASINLDFQPDKALLYRLEYRLLSSLDPIFPSNTGPSTIDSFATISAALSF
jgi:hypothetical protein